MDAKLRTEMGAERMLAEVSDAGATVHFIGFKTKKELAVYYKAADVFCLPTKSDVWGLVINEAMSYGLPVVTTDMCIAGLTLLTPEQVAKVDNVEELAEKICNLLDNENGLGQRNYKLIQDYTNETMAAEHMRILEKL